MSTVWPAVGQVYADLDPRMTGRTLKVTKVGSRYVTLEVLTDRENIVKPTVGRDYDVLAARLMQGPYRLLA